MAGNGSPTAQINITPWIDVLLVLIIVFMVVVSILQQKWLGGGDSTAGQGRDEPAWDAG